MSRPQHKAVRQPAADVFAALGDPIRLQILARLAADGRSSLSHIAQVAPISRQGVSKHLRVLQGAGLLQCTRRGREALFELDPGPLGKAQEVLDAISSQWDDALARLKLLTEE